MKTTRQISERPTSAAPANQVELSIVMPCLNEERTVGACVTSAFGAIERLGIRGEVVVADNGSTDGSIEVAQSRGARVVHVEQVGYGSALRAGCEAAGGRFIIMGDSDGAHDYSEIDRFVRELHEGCELVVGNRFKGRILPGAMSWKNRHIGNPLLSWILRLLFRTKVADAHCGLRGFTKIAYEQMDLRTKGMEFASEMLIKAAKLKLRTAEVPITLHPAGRVRPPHLRPFRDGWRHMKLMLMFSPTALFLVPGLGLLLIGMALTTAQLFAPRDRPLLVFGIRFDIHWAILGSILALVGYQILTVSFFARVYSVTHRIREEDRLLHRAFQLLTLDRVLVLSIVVMVSGLVLDGIVVLRWLRPEIGLEAVHTRHFILGSTLLALGVQTFFNAFFFSILGDAYRAQRVVQPGSSPSPRASWDDQERVDPPVIRSTVSTDYANRLRQHASVWWKRILPVQAPYRWHVRRLRLGRTLDVGCGYGRNLNHLKSQAIGVDHNPRLIEAARAHGLEAYTPEEFRSSPQARPQSFDTLLFSHILEHLREREAKSIVQTYLPYLRPGGQVVVFTPQERGYATDPTHVEFTDFQRVQSLCDEAGLLVERKYSFPLPRWAGRMFPYNEFVVIARLPVR